MKQLSVSSGVLLLILVYSVVFAQVGGTDLKRGQGLYEQYCSRCHGLNGDGLGPEAQYLIVPPASFKSSQLTMKTDEDLLMAISQGVLFSPMHAWRDRLSEQDMKDIIGYVRMLSPFTPISKHHRGGWSVDLARSEPMEW